jgi:hypothetical protein
MTRFMPTGKMCKNGSGFFYLKKIAEHFVRNSKQINYEDYYFTKKKMQKSSRDGLM